MLCAALAQEISDLRDEINRRYMQYGNRESDVRRIAGAKQDACNGNPRGMIDVCNELVIAQSRAEDGRTASALFAVANACGIAQGIAQRSMSPLTQGIGAAFMCLAAQRAIEEIERALERQRQMSLQWHYRYDIEPQEQRLRGLEAQLRDCNDAGLRPQSPWPVPSDCAGDCTNPLWDWWDRGYSSCSNCCSRRCPNMIDWSVCNRQCENYHRR